MLCVTIRDDDSASDIVQLGHATAGDNEPAGQTVQQQLPKRLTIHVGDGDALLKRVARTTRTELVLAPVELHRRNIQRRLREAQLPKDGLQCTDPTDVATQLLATDTHPPTPLDRIDRLSMIRSIRSDDEGSITSPAVPAEPRTLEQIRTVIENVTGFHPERLDVFRTVGNGLTPPLDADIADLVEAATTIEQRLRHRSSTSVSEVQSVRRATRRILDTDGDVFRQTYPDIDRVSLVGISSVAISHIDLLHAVVASVSIPVHIHLRAGTGAYLSHRVSQLFDVSNPGTVVFPS
jgi:ATP-dependent helicase/nuclease subunit B